MFHTYILTQVAVHGSVAEGLEPVKELFQEQFNKGEELSAQVGCCWIVITTVSGPILNGFLKVCVYLKGQKVVDLAGSSVDTAYNADSLQVGKKRESSDRLDNQDGSNLSFVSDYLELDKELDRPRHGLPRGQRLALLL